MNHTITQRLVQLNIDMDALTADLDALIALEKQRREKAGPQQPGDFNDNARLLWKPEAKRAVHLEPDYFLRWPQENCSECGKPTRYWLTPHVPLCQDCAWRSPNTKSNEPQS